MNKLSTNKNSRNYTKELKNSITSKVSNIASKGKEMANVAKEKAQEVSSKMKNSTGPQASMFSLDGLKNKTTEFTEANSSISKFVFIIMLLFVFLALFNLGAWAIQYFMGANKNPILLNGMVNANKTRKISVNPNESDSVPIYRSINEDQGIEFTWNIWFFVDGLNVRNPTYSRIFSKGSENTSLNLNIPTSCSDNSCRNIVNNSPGLFITQNKQKDDVFPNTNLPTKDQNNVNLIMVINTFQPSQSNKEFAESITIENIPVQKWICATIRVQQTTVDVYINGVMTQRKKLNNVPRQNYYDVLVGDANDGFNGSISALRYFNKALGYDEIQSLFGQGPNLKSLDTDGLSKNGTDYISMNWYYKS